MGEVYLVASCVQRVSKILAARTGVHGRRKTHQFEALASAVEKESPTKGLAMREWSPDAQMALLKWLSDVVHEQPNPTNEIELRCVFVHLPTGDRREAI